MANMERKSIEYSLKNIPLSGSNNYLLKLIAQTESFIKRMRWKAFFYENGSSNQKCKFKTFGFKSVKSPPANERLVNFENDLYNLIKSVKFHKHNDKFQERLSNDVRKIKKSSDVFVFADKTTNIYKIGLQ